MALSEAQIRYAVCIRFNMTEDEQSNSGCHEDDFYGWSKKKMSKFIDSNKEFAKGKDKWRNFPKSAMREIAEDYVNGEVKDSYDTYSLPLVVPSHSIGVEEVPSVVPELMPRTQAQADQVVEAQMKKLETWLKQVDACARAMAIRKEVIEMIARNDSIQKDKLVHFMVSIAMDLGITEDEEISFLKDPTKLQAWFEKNYNQKAVDMGMTRNYGIYLGDRTPEERKKWVVGAKLWRARNTLNVLFQLTIADMKGHQEYATKRREMLQMWGGKNCSTEKLYELYKQVRPAHLPSLKDLDEKHPKIFHRYWFVSGTTPWSAVLTDYWCDTITHDEEAWYEYVEFSPDGDRHGFRMSKQKFDRGLLYNEILVEKPAETPAKPAKPAETPAEPAEQWKEHWVKVLKPEMDNKGITKENCDNKIALDLSIHERKRLFGMESFSDGATLVRSSYGLSHLPLPDRATTPALLSQWITGNVDYTFGKMYWLAYLANKNPIKKRKAPLPTRIDYNDPRRKRPREVMPKVPPAKKVKPHPETVEAERQHSEMVAKVSKYYVSSRGWLPFDDATVAELKKKCLVKWKSDLFCQLFPANFHDVQYDDTQILTKLTLHSPVDATQDDIKLGLAQCRRHFLRMGFPATGARPHPARQ